ncbi:MAG: hypothetical protein NT023_02605 [Armatimonadetes bacterium]|nr:hypothetical protein [Armatimonadota bacterium]
MPQEQGLIWDACTLLNLIATKRASEILTALASPSYVVREVREREVLYLRPLPEDDPQGKLIKVDLEPLFSTGVLQEVEMTEEEQRLFVMFASEMDDGEARSTAVAVQRGWRLVTDDKVSLRIAREYSPAIPTLTTPEWVKAWAEKAPAKKETLSETLRRIEACANYTPRRLHSLKAWWEANTL